MICDVCGAPATRQDITGALCERHQDTLRQAYFAWRANGRDPSLFRVSAEHDEAALTALALESAEP